VTEEAIPEIVARLDRQFRGKRVLLKGAHPWAGYVADYVEFRDTYAGPRPVVRPIHEGIGAEECFVMNPGEMEVLG
jgi:hypothetical protein